MIMKNRMNYQGELSQNERLMHYTTWRVGGIAKQLYKPTDVDDLALFIKELPTTEPLLWLGLGSNLLIRDAGFLGTVILMQGCLKKIHLLEENLVHVEAGVSCATMARFCARMHLSGGEFWAGIPGTMGGALKMNAGCAGDETWRYVEYVETMTRQGERRIRRPDEFQIAYRQVIGLEDEAFISAACRMPRGEKATSLQRIKTLLQHRTETQPTNEANCGSVFRNPPGDFAARLIEACGLKGQQLGGAMVSKKHANFIINHQEKASSSDIESLIQYVHDAVLEKTRIALMPEVHIVGERR
ncbi:MAG: UDP-N-acetylmuramate dehydrogenase [Legionella sp.]|nr:UDP-N-acetylmuramate dehydrogenase [Legionella sp.]